ncbi:MAG TPA: ABC transporter ATP-binding protein [Chthonomonadales bacterium]|nr:ABC transporter ATP-binding protein [Chthonomonadales bacterium]
MSMAAVEVRSVSRWLGGRQILADVSFDAMPGETLAIVGPSGSGKSTLLNIVGGLDRADTGSVCVGGADVGALSGSALSLYRATSVGFVFQEHVLLPQLTGLENVLLPSLASRQRPEAKRALELLASLGVEGVRDAFPATMSGGERQRVAVARALINGPRVLLCDEPTGNLDSASGSAVVDLLRGAAESRGVCVLLVTHNHEHAARMSRVMELRDGRLAS